MPGSIAEAAVKIPRMLPIRWHRRHRAAAMIVSQSTVQSSSEHYAFKARQVTESLRIDARRPVPAPAATAEVGAKGAVDEDDGVSPDLGLLKAIIEHMLGREIKLFRMDRHDGPRGRSDGANVQAGAQRGGPGFEYERVERMAEAERTSFQARGAVKTEDGREIAFDVSLVMERTFASESRVVVSTGPARAKDPLMLNLDGGPARVMDARFRFDLNDDGTADTVPSTAGSTVLLAYDRNGNARIDSGAELFGPATGDGFAELALLDSDGNGWIDAGDSVFPLLSLWKPGDDGGTLTSLADAGLGALQVNAIATPFSLRNANNETLGQVRASSVYLTEAGGAGVIQQVDVVV
jgi:hypothetical protein